LGVLRLALAANVTACVGACVQVLSKGGSELVGRSQGWEDLAAQMQLIACPEEPEPGKKLEKIHHKFLLRFELNAGPQNWPALLQLSVMVSARQGPKVACQSDQHNSGSGT
jgi:hypothetical protein